MADTIRKAFKIAMSGRRGPVLIDIPKDVTANKTDYEYKEPEKIDRIVDTIDNESISKAVEMISNSKKPFIFVGGGVIAADASKELRELVDRIDAPVCDTLMGKGAFNGQDLRYAGMLGMHGTKAANFGVSQCDLLLAVGVRFSDRVYGNAKNFAKNAKIIHIDIDEKEINKNIKADVSIIGDAKEILSRILKVLPKGEHKEWRDTIDDMSNKHPLVYNKDTLSAGSLLTEIYNQTNGDAIISTEVGQHQMWAAQFYKYKNPRQFLTSGGLGTMGYGLGAALGAKMACPNKTVINIAGDGGFRMNMNELATASRNNIPVIEVIINNRVLGMVRQWQTLFYGKRYSNTVLTDCVDFVKVAEAMGCVGFKVETLADFSEVFSNALTLNKPVLIDCRIDMDDNVYPMVAPGEPISKAFDASDLKK